MFNSLSFFLVQKIIFAFDRCDVEGFFLLVLQGKTVNVIRMNASGIDDKACFDCLLWGLDIIAITISINSKNWAVA